MLRISSFVVMLFGAIFTIIAFGATLNVYEKPEEKAKIVAKMESGEHLIPIFHSDNKDWVKVANPQNGDVGWVKAKELNGPIITTQINGTTYQQVIIGDDEQPQVYSVIQYSGPKQLKSDDAKKIREEMEESHRRMEKSMQKMRKHMQRNMIEMFRDFDESFESFSLVQPMIIVPEGYVKAKEAKKQPLWKRIFSVGSKDN